MSASQTGLCDKYESNLSPAQLSLRLSSAPFSSFWFLYVCGCFPH